jgi:8-oxo-dGTP diphosphatase
LIEKQRNRCNFRQKYFFVKLLEKSMFTSTDFSKYFTTAFSVDNVIFGFDDADIKILLIRRGLERQRSIYQDMWALPGDLVNPDEDLDGAAYRVLDELTGLKNVYLEQVKAFGAVHRHPVGRVITVSYFSLIKISDYEVMPNSFAERAEWYTIKDARQLTLAFDHSKIVETCFNALKQRIRVAPIGFELLPPKFTLTELQQLYESILERTLEKRNFRKKILGMNFIVDLKESQERVAHRPARLYEFNQAKYENLVAKGFSFEL